MNTKLTILVLFLALMVDATKSDKRPGKVNRWLRRLVCLDSPKVNEHTGEGDKGTKERNANSQPPQFRGNPVQPRTLNMLTLPGPDTDSFFGNSYTCTKFQNWKGYSVNHIQKKVSSLRITEQSAWQRWWKDTEYVFLGYRGTEKIWAEKAAQKHYLASGMYGSYGNGIYMSPHAATAIGYPIEATASPRRICYNFAPKRILVHLLQCFRDNSHAGSQTIYSNPSRPREVSARFSPLRWDDPRSPVGQVVYPTAFLPYIKVICIDANLNSKITIPALFEYNNPYYDSKTKSVQLQLTPLRAYR